MPFSQKEEMIVEFYSSHQNNQSGKLNDPSTSFICSISDSSIAEPGSPDQFSLLGQLPSSLWAKSSIDIGRTHSASPIKIQTDSSKSLPRINQYPISKEAIQGIKPISEDYKTRGLITPCTSPCEKTQGLRVEIYPGP